MSKVELPSATEVAETTGISREKKLEKVIKGNVRTRKKSGLRRMRDTFLEEDGDAIKSYIIEDVIVPEIKESILEIVSIVLFGSSNKAKKRSNNNSYVSYSSYSSPSKKPQNQRKTKVEDLNDIIFESRGEAEEVLSALVDILDDYQAVTVADLYDAVGITGNFTDNKYGWTDLSGASVSRARGGGYVINLPRAIFID